MKKAGIKIPISVAGKIDDPALAEEILADGKADFISIARGLICDPYWPTKAKEGRPEDIRPLYLRYRCLEDVVMDFVPLCPCIGKSYCSAKRESFSSKLPRLTRKKKVLVLGGGPGGMQAAIIAAQKRA